MKRALSWLMFVVFLLGVFQVSVSALIVQPDYYNVYSVTATLYIDSSGLATVNLSYTGIDGVTTRGTIDTTLQKRYLFFFWTYVDGWYETMLRSSYSSEHSVQLTSTGTYRIVSDFTIYGSGGDPDEIQIIDQETYS